MSREVIRRMSRPLRRRLRAAALALAVAPVVAAAGCTVGSGAGSAMGPIWVLGCGPAGDLGTEMSPTTFDLHPGFFAGQPIEDLSTGVHSNRLLIRMQRSGNGIEVTDTLDFDAVNAYEVARCLRGHTTMNGQPDWDTRFVSDEFGRLTNQVWCDWSGGAAAADGSMADASGADASVDAAADGGGADAGGADAGPGPGPVQMTALRPRIYISTLDFVRSSLALLFSCNMARLVGAGVVGGWIEFLDFGAATQSDRPPEMRDPVTSDFKVNYGDRLRASFHVVLLDDRVVNARINRLPDPGARMGGTLDGSFDFIMDRGRAAQPFP
jgi:hypothetical protein